VRQLAAAQALDQACLALCEGQYFDMVFEEQVGVDLDQYLWMIRHKTGALLAASAQLGAIVATDDQDIIHHHYQFGESLGMAFQIQDDILGAWGDPLVTGKSAAIDIRDKKKSLPVVYALNSTNPAAAKRLAHLYSQQGPLEGDGIESVLDLLDGLDARVYCEEMAEAYYRQALDSLDQAGTGSAAHAHLRELAGSLLGRET
jgi:geranylgeranyl diphosphate synthase type I